MTGRVYTTKEIFVDGTKIKVRQPVFKGKDHVPELVSKALTEARRAVAMALHQCNPSGFVNAVKLNRTTATVDPKLFKMVFLEKPNHANLTVVWSKLGQLHHKLCQPFGIKVLDLPGSTNGYVTPYYPITQTAASLSMRKLGHCCKVDGSIWRDKDGDALHSKGEIHLMLHRLEDEELAPKTLIHEAGHKFVNLKDYSYIDPPVMRSPTKINSVTALDNADSYAWLAFMLKNPDYGTYDGVSGLFN
jgi:hypothetical protein